MPKWVYQFNSSNCEGTVSQKPLLGGKGANLAEMGKLGLPVEVWEIKSQEIRTLGLFERLSSC